ncbi:hypothetical protein G9A89_000614, partial [Geosiphon pyriformis]
MRKLQSNLKNIPHRAHIRNCLGNNMKKNQLPYSIQPLVLLLCLVPQETRSLGKYYPLNKGPGQLI